MTRPLIMTPLYMIIQNFRGLNFRELPQNREIQERFHPRKISAMWYYGNLLNTDLVQLHRVCFNVNTMKPHLANTPEIRPSAVMQTLRAVPNLSCVHKQPLI